MSKILNMEGFFVTSFCRTIQLSLCHSLVRLEPGKQKKAKVKSKEVLHVYFELFVAA